MATFICCAFVVPLIAVLLNVKANRIYNNVSGVWNV